MASNVTNNLTQRNEQYASTFKQGDLASPPAKKYAVVTCMDARLDPAAAFGIDLGDAHVIRNAGGNARDALRSLVISQQLLGTREILLVKHTQCGMLTFQNEDARKVVKDNLGDKAAAAVQDLDFQPFADLHESVKDDVQWLQHHAALKPDAKVTGWVYDVTTGKVSPV